MSLSRPILPINLPHINTRQLQLQTRNLKREAENNTGTPQMYPFTTHYLINDQGLPNEHTRCADHILLFKKRTTHAAASETCHAHARTPNKLMKKKALVGRYTPNQWLGGTRPTKNEDLRMYKLGIHISVVERYAC